MPQPAPSTETPPTQILLALKRQADRDNAHGQADAAYRENLAQAGIERQALASRQTAARGEPPHRNTRLTEMTCELSRRIDQLTTEMQAALVRGNGALSVEAAGPDGGGTRP